MPSLKKKKQCSAAEVRDERGVALLLSLGILALLLILGMSFAFMARTNRASATVYSDLTKARLYTESGLHRVTAYMRYMFDPAYEQTAGTPFWTDAGRDKHDLLMPPSATAALFGTGTLGNKRFFVSGVSVGSTDDAGLDEALKTVYGFELVPSGAYSGFWDHVLNSDDDLIARIGYICINETGKLDPNWVTSSTVAEGDEVRVGQNPDEIDLSQAVPAGITVNHATTGFQPLPDADGAGTPTQWFSLYHIANVVGGMTGADARTASEAIFPQTSRDTNTYWNDADDSHDWTAGDSSPDRLNLRNADYWDHDGTNDLDVSSIQSSIPWLASLEASTDVDGDGDVDADDNARLRNQVAANFIDYFDGDGATTNDYDGSTVPITEATYVGLEKCPYVNEVFLTANINNLGGTPVNYELELDARVELINIYDSPLSGGTAILEVTLTCSEFDTSPAVLTYTLSAYENPPNPDTSTVPANGYLVYNDADSQTVDMNTDSSVTDLTVTSVKVHVISGSAPVTNSNLLDYAEKTTASGAVSFTGPTTAMNSIEVRDPRHNLPDSEWSWAGWNTAGASGTEGAANADPYTDPNGSGSPDYGVRDMEQVDDPAAGLSTAYIRNGVPQSLWEIGAIHRGEAWRTINLKKYGVTGLYADFDADTSGTIEDDEKGGDAALIEQLSLSSGYRQGMFNVNSPVQAAWEAVLAMNYPSDGYASPGTGGTSFSGADVSDIASDILIENGTNSPVPPADTTHPLPRRGMIVNATMLWDDTASITAGAGYEQNTDARREEIIGRTADLLSVSRKNYFRVIVIGQAVKDLGGVDPGAGDANDEYFSYDGGTNFCRVLAEQKIMAIIERDVFTNSYRVVRYEYLED